MNYLKEVNIHDNINLLSISCIIAFTLYQKYGKNTNKTYTMYFYMCVSYWIIDFIWIYNFPMIVKKHNEILVHHIITIFMTVFQHQYPELRYYLYRLYLVEINTLFLILKRNNDLRIAYIAIPLFRLTFVFIRLYMYPMTYWILYHDHCCIKLKWLSFIIFLPLNIMNIFWASIMWQNLKM